MDSVLSLMLQWVSLVVDSATQLADAASVSEATPVSESATVPLPASESDAELMKPDLPDFGGQLVRMAVSLSGLVGVLIVILLVLRRMRSGSWSMPQHARAMRVLARMPIDQGKQLIVVEVAGETLLLASTQGELRQIGGGAVTGDSLAAAFGESTQPQEEAQP